MGCGESFEGVAVGADMYHQQNVKAFIGPYCNAEMDAVSGSENFGKMLEFCRSARWPPSGQFPPPILSIQ